MFNRFELIGAGESTGIKFGYGIYLTESEVSAVHYSQPRHMDFSPMHYLYTVEVPDLRDDNHLISAREVSIEIVAKVEKQFGIEVPNDIKATGKDFRKWIGCILTGARKSGFEEEKRAAEYLDSLGVIYNVWPTSQIKPDGLKNVAVFNARHIRIVNVEEITIEQKSKKWVLLNRKEVRL